MKFDEQQKVVDVVRDIAEYVDMGGGKKLTATQLLQHFLFSPQQQHNYVYKLSGGEKRKLYLCTVLMQNPNFLVLDEPTNDLDIQTLQILEEYLQDFPGCVIVVSHDRYFMDKVVDHLLVFKGNGVIKDFPGNYTQYRKWNTMAEQTRLNDSPQKAKSPKDSKPDSNSSSEKPEKNAPRKLTYKERLEIQQLEKEIEVLEKEQKKLEEQLCSGLLSVQELTAKSIQLPKIKEQIDEKTMRWLMLSEIQG